MTEPQRKKVALAKQSLLDLYDQYKDFEGLDKNVVFDIIKDLTPEELASLELLSKSIRRMVIRAYPLYWKYRVEEDYPRRKYEMTDKLKNNLDSISRKPGREETYWKRLYELYVKQEEQRRFKMIEHFYKRIYFPMHPENVVLPSENNGYVVYKQRFTELMDYNIETKTGNVIFFETLKSKNARYLNISPTQKFISYIYVNQTYVVSTSNILFNIIGNYKIIFIKDNIFILYKKDRLEKVRIFMLNDGEFIESNERYPNLIKIDTEQVNLYDKEYLLLSNERDYYSYYIYSLSMDRILVQHKNDEIGSFFPIGIKDNILYSLKTENNEFILIQYSLLKGVILDKRTLKNFTRFRNVILPPLSLVCYF